jgi:preprotein translocase subunit YajC
MIDALEVGREIVTAGGLYGTVTELVDDEVHLEIAEGVEVRIAKRAVAGIIPPDEEPEELEAAEEPEGETPANLSR